MMKTIRALASAIACLVSTSAWAQTETFSTYVTGLAAVSSVIGTEKMFALQTGVPKTVTPYQIMSLVSGDCTMASPPSIVCAKTGGVTFSPSATTDTTNATNISSGTLGLSRLTLASASIYVGNASNNPAAAVMSGDCTITNAGVITCPKANGVTFAASATTDTTNATNISSGTLAGARYAAANLAAGGNGGVTGVLPFASMPTGSLDTVLGYFGSTTLNAIAIGNCTGALQYSTTTHNFPCNTGGGSGNVINSGTPTVGQYGIWVDATHLQGVSSGSLAHIVAVKQTVYTSSTTYTPSTGIQQALLECVGGGGAGGGSTGQVGYYFNGGGGGAGSYSRSRVTAAQIGVSKAVTIGAGGTAVGGGTGGNGSASSIGSLVIANPGIGGTFGGVGQGGNGGAGGSQGTGDFTGTGQPGGNGLWQQLNAGVAFIQLGPGAGGSSIWGAGGTQGITGDASSINGNVGGPYGGGGSGSQSNDVAGNGTGGNGASGACIVTEFTNQ